MILKQLSLQNFRNYKAVEVGLHPQVTHIVGDNAQGKTNLLEAVFFLGRGVSFRTSAREDLINHNAEKAYLRATSVEDGLVDEFGAELGRRGRRFLCNGKGVRRPDAKWPHIILFAPEETLLFKGGPSGRREYLDTLIEGMDPAYRGVRRNFTKVLQQRNRLLSQLWEAPRSTIAAQLGPWSDHLIQWGCRIVAARHLWLNRLVEQIPEIHARFAAPDGELKLVYEPNITADPVIFQETLEARRDEELARGVTLVGPHRDELKAELSGFDLRHYGSQGQHRSVLLSLKVAEVALGKAHRDRTPILLLDDVASELDPRRASAFFTALEEKTCQILLTTTHLEPSAPKEAGASSALHIEAGRVL